MHVHFAIASCLGFFSVFLFFSISTDGVGNLLERSGRAAENYKLCQNWRTQNGTPHETIECPVVAQERRRGQ